MNESVLANESFYHVFTKSIAGFKVFNKDDEYNRMLDVIEYYIVNDPVQKFSVYAKFDEARKNCLRKEENSQKLVRIIAYCLMPTHLHLLLEQSEKNGISIFMNKILNSYTRYFNCKLDRKGPLWESRFKHVLVKSEEQLMHLTRYIHLNPVTAYLVDSPEKWKWSSYGEYMSKEKARIICLGDTLDIDPSEYERFVKNRIDDQRELAKIKSLLLD